MIRRFASILRAASDLLDRRASIENPSTPIDEAHVDDWFDGALGGDKVAAGVKVSRETALRYSPIWRGVNLISGDVAKLPCLIYRREGEGKQRATEHPAFRLLRRKPNREMTAFVFKRLMISLGILEGNGIAYIDRAGDGSPVEIIPLGPGKCWAVREGGRLLYVVEIAGQLRKLLPENVFHVKGPSSDGLMGDRLYDRARESLGLGIAARDYGARFFRNNARPSVVIQHPKQMSGPAVDNLRRSWNDIHAGVENSHKVAILEEGATIQPFTINARDSQLLETRQFEIREIANWIGVPPHKLGDQSKSSYNSLEQENQSYLDDALDPWLVAFEEEAYDKLLTEDEKRADSHTIEFMRQALLRADMKTRGEFYAKATGGLPWMTGNEVRGRENLNPLDGFDEIRVPTNNFGPADGGDPGKDAEDDARRAAAARAVVLDAARRMAKRLVVHARKAAARSPVELDEWLNDGGARRDHLATVTEAFGPVAAVLASVGREPDADVIAERFMQIAEEAIDRREAAELVADAEQAALVAAIADAVIAALTGD